MSRRPVVCWVTYNTKYPTSGYLLFVVPTDTLAHVVTGAATSITKLEVVTFIAPNTRVDEKFNFMVF